MKRIFIVWSLFLILVLTLLTGGTVSYSHAQCII